MSTALTVFLVVVTVLLVLAVAIALVVTVWVGRHVARAGRVAGRGVRTGRARVQASLPGPAQEVHAQRLRVERERAATASAWSEARRAGRRSVRELAPHQPVLEATGRRLANDLAIVAAEPDDWRRRAWLAEVRPAVDAYVRACGQFRQGVLLVGDAYGDGAFSLTATALSELVAREHERVTGYRDIGVLDVQAVPGGSAGSGVSLSKAPVVR